MLNGLDLFSGIGGLALALEPWVRAITYCEINRHAQSVLLARQSCGKLPIAPIWDDVRTLSGANLPAQPDLIYGGFPCQGVSIAGVGKGLEDERSGLFSHFPRLAGESGYPDIFLENVPAITIPDRGGWRVVATLAGLGYDCRWCVIPVGDNANWHRWFLLARHPKTRSTRRRKQYTTTQPEGARVHSGMDSLILPGAEGAPTQSKILRMDHDVPYRVDRITAMGNAVVWLQARRAFEILSGLRGTA